jgi:isopenicillin N synthase-like dioxygenase
LQHDEYSEDADSVPIIDLACYRNGDAAAKQKLLSQVREACVDWGFFQIVNHNFSLELVERVRSQALKLFTLPLETKRTVEKSPGEFTGFGHATVKAGDVQPWSEGFYLNSVSKVDEVARTLWPQGYNSDFV